MKSKQHVCVSAFRAPKAKKCPDACSKMSAVEKNKVHCVHCVIVHTLQLNPHVVHRLKLSNASFHPSVLLCLRLLDSYCCPLCGNSSAVHLFECSKSMVSDSVSVVKKIVHFLVVFFFLMLHSFPWISCCARWRIGFNTNTEAVLASCSALFIHNTCEKAKISEHSKIAMHTQPAALVSALVSKAQFLYFLVSIWNSEYSV